jgi:molybdopterin/thiamine biosynthesis adenylyltransferase/rhodanese-related sulfurtransferase
MDKERYQRQISLKGFGEGTQQKLSGAKVLVVGAGGIGCPALQYLTAAGVGMVGIVDDDTIALSNLHRQILYKTTDIGKLKVSVAAKRLQEMNPETEVRCHPVHIDRHNILQIFGSYDIIMDGTDNFETRYLINDACALLKKPLVFAAVSGYEGQVAIFNQEDEKGISTVYRDLFPIPPAPGEIANCAENGVLGVLPGIIGTMAAGEVIKLICKIGKPLINQLLHYSLLTNEQYVMQIGKGKDYRLPETEQELHAIHTANRPETSFSEITGVELAALRDQASTIFIDVREKHEFPVLDSRFYKKAPMSAFQQLLETVIEEKNIVIICQHGVRSIAAAEELCVKYGNTKNIYSLKGGIVKWQHYF